MPKPPTRPTDENNQTPPEARTDGNVSRILPARKLQSAPADHGPNADRSLSPAPSPEGETNISDDDLTADALRHALDHGQGGDKIDFMDPTAAPLGTDAEAGGNPPTREQIRQAARHELGASRSPEVKQQRRIISLRVKDGMGLGLLVIAAILAILLVLLALRGA